MPNNFHYAAYSYLDQWMFSDRGFHEALKFDTSSRQSADSSAKALLKFATEYGVIRTLKVKAGESRLRAAFDALNEVEQPSESDVISKVESLARTLGDQYCVGKIPLSAASKFLWMRFRSPVIIRDQLAADWLRRHAGYAGSSYSDYYRCWQSEFSKHDDQLRAACTDLLCLKKFTRACDEPDEVLSEWTSSRWFRERVF